MSFDYVLLDLMQHRRFHVVFSPGLVNAAVVCRRVTIIPIALCDVVENYTRPPQSYYLTTMLEMLVFNTLGITS